MPRGGVRPNSGRKKKPLAEKQLYGNIGHETADKLKPPLAGGMKLNEIPEIADYIKNASAQIGDGEIAEKRFNETWKWIDAKGCAECVKRELVEQYAVTYARWVYCVEKTNLYGVLTKGSSVSGLVLHPIYAESKALQKELRDIWFVITQIVKENATLANGGHIQPDDPIARILAE
jgi:hypothetical protein